jgi:hypothetical protein
MLLLERHELILMCIQNLAVRHTIHMPQIQIYYNNINNNINNNKT